jgi:hypothetical protein
MALAAWQATIVDEGGNVQANAAIAVLRDIAGQPPAQCYSDRNGSTPIGSTFNADADGFVRFFAAGGAYQITATLGAFSRVWRYVPIGTAAETDGELLPTFVSTAWVFDDATSAADPGSGFFRLNHATPASATAIYVDNENVGGNSVTAWLDSLDDSTSTIKGQLTICDPEQPAEVFRVYDVSGAVVDSTGYRTITIAHVAGAGSFTEGTRYSFSFSAAGDAGEGSGDVSSSLTLTAGAGLTGGGDLSTNRSFAVGAGTGITVNADDVAIDKASDSEVRSAASNQVLTSDLIESASALVTLTESAGAVAVDWDTFINGTVTVDQNSSISNPTNGQPGTWRTIYVIGNDTTDRTITFGNQFDGDIPTITDCDSTRAYLLMIFLLRSLWDSHRIQLWRTEDHNTGRSL